MTIRLLCIETTPQPCTIPPPPYPAQRAYSATRGQVIDVPGDLSGDAAALLGFSDPYPGGTAYFTLVVQSGPTSLRPSPPKAGVLFLDTTLSIVIAWDGANFRNVVSGAIA